MNSNHNLLKIELQKLSFLELRGKMEKINQWSIFQLEETLSQPYAILRIFLIMYTKSNGYTLNTCAKWIVHYF